MMLWMQPLSVRINMPPVHDGKKREPKADKRKSTSPSSTPETTDSDLTAASEPPQTQALGRSRGGLTSKVHLLVEGRGRPLGIVLTAGQVHDSTQIAQVLDRVRVPRKGPGRPRKRPVSVLTDKAYGGRPARKVLRDRRISALIPTKDNEREARNKRGSDGGRPFKFEKERYRMRNVVERCINRLKQSRRIATRYDKLADSYLAFITIASILIWLRS
jgi:transposase